jgi:hypothetical protein
MNKLSGSCTLFAHRTPQPRRKYRFSRGIHSLAPGLLEFDRNFSLTQVMREANT